jgi:hypothetical protein
MRTKRRPKVTLGWREWVALPDHGIDWIKAKVDTGARTSALHAHGMRWFKRDGADWVRFRIQPWQRSARDAHLIELPVVEVRHVRSSSGHPERRPVVHITICLAGRKVPIEVTLTRRDEMGFRMLLGRQAVRRDFVVDPSQSYLAGRPPVELRRRNRQPEAASGFGPEPR